MCSIISLHGIWAVIETKATGLKLIHGIYISIPSRSYYIPGNNLTNVLGDIENQWLI